VTDCIFCKIVTGDIPADKVFENDEVVAFNDIQPQAPVHVLVIPKKHVATVDDLEDGDESLAGKMVLAGRDVARSLGVAGEGYRLVMNCGRASGQLVFHIHLHVLGGRDLGALVPYRQDCCRKSTEMNGMDR